MRGVGWRNDDFEDFKKVRIETIHGVPVYGKLPKRHVESLNKVKQLTTKDEWRGIKGVYCSDGILNSGILGMYITAQRNSKDMSAELYCLQGDSKYHKLKLTYEDVPAVIISSFKDEYSFATVLTHELGHHVNGDNADNVHRKPLEEREIEAHIFAMQRIKRNEFEFKKDMKSYFWKEAKTEYFKRYGLDVGVHDVEATKTKWDVLNKTLGYFIDVKLNVPKYINHNFKELKNKIMNTTEKKQQLKSPWKTSLLVF